MRPIALFAARNEVASGTLTLVDVVTNFTDGSADALITATNLTNSTFGVSPGTWTQFVTAAVPHTYIRNTPGNLPFAILCNGTTYKTYSRAMEFDKSMGTPPAYTDYDDFLNTLSANRSNISFWSLCSFNVLDEGSDVGIDTFSVGSTTSFAVGGQRVTLPGASGQGFMRAHTNLGGQSPDATSPAIAYSTLYALTVKHDKTNGRARVALVTALTNTLVGEIDSLDTLGDATNLQVADYLNMKGGKFRHHFLAFDWTNNAFPIGPVIIPAPTAVQASKTGATEATLTWAGKTSRYKIERSTNGTWGTLDASYRYVSSATRSYVDTTVSGSNVYLYRVTAIIDSITSPLTTTGAPITANTAVFDGTNDYLSIAATPAGIADSKTFTLSMWIKPTLGGSDRMILGTANDRISAFWRTDGKIQIFAAMSSGTTTLNVSTTNPALTDGVWQHLLISMNTASSAACLIQIDGVSQTMTYTLVDNNLIDLDGAGAWRIGAKGNASSDERANGAFAEFWFDDSYIATAGSFAGIFGSAGKPINIGATGNNPTGSAPAIYLSLVGDGNSWASDSSGNSNNFTVTGTLGTTTPP